MSVKLTFSVLAAIVLSSPALADNRNYGSVSYLPQNSFPINPIL
jgi:hypothetical protein